MTFFTAKSDASHPHFTALRQTSNYMSSANYEKKRAWYSHHGHHGTREETKRQDTALSPRQFLVIQPSINKRLQDRHRVCLLAVRNVRWLAMSCCTCLMFGSVADTFHNIQPFSRLSTTAFERECDHVNVTIKCKFQIEVSRNETQVYSSSLQTQWRATSSSLMNALSQKHSHWLVWKLVK